MKSTLSQKSQTILELIAQGHTYEQILALHNSYTYMDIFQAAQEALNKLVKVGKTVNNDERIKKIRKTYPRAYEAWEAEEENKLKQLHKSGNTISEICSILQRQPGAIESRLRKLGLIEE